jgi:two-component system, LytTR family, sensor kinase
MSRKKIVYLHVFIWLFAAFANLPLANLGSEVPAKQIASYVIAFLYLMVVFYLFYFVVVPAFLDKKRITLFLILSFLIVLVMPFFGYTLLFLNKAIFEGSFRNFYSGYSLKMHMSGYYPVLTAAVFGSFFRVIINWFTTMNQKSDLDREKLAIELELLKNKLNPHFLFNTLNNIDSLIQKDTTAASAALIKLSDIMRYLTYETSSDKVELRKEVEYIENIISLYRLRIRSAEDIQFTSEGDTSVRIAPALFVPFIENAFKFAGFRGQKPSISIKLSSSNGIVCFNCSNYFDPVQTSPEAGHSGTGLLNVRKRLELIYPGKYDLIADKSADSFLVKLKIDINAD